MKLEVCRKEDYTESVSCQFVTKICEYKQFVVLSWIVVVLELARFLVAEFPS